MVLGYIHKTDSLGTVDGPGIRYIVFLQGCKMRCLYCHNPDSWGLKQGKQQSVDEVFAEVLRSKKYMDHSGGGLTVSGGEPLLQAEFVLALFERAKQENIHTCLDTNGFIEANHPLLDKILSLTDLVLFDIKHLDPQKHQELTGQKIDLPLGFIEKLKEKNIPLWLRQVLLDDWTTGEDYAHQLAKFAIKYPNIEYVELLPFHQLGKYKWDECGIAYKLADATAPNRSTVLAMQAIIESYQLKTLL